MEECRVVFNKYDKRRRGYIDLYDLKKALEEIDIKFSHPYVFHKMVSEQKDNSGSVTMADFCKMVAERKDTGDEDGDDILDAFVAMGGQENGSGNIDADKLVSLIKNELSMTIQIEDMIKQVDVDDSGEVDLGEFKSLQMSEGENPEITIFKDWFDYN